MTDRLLLVTVSDACEANSRFQIIMPNQGGTHQQHVKAGQQSHKNDARKQQPQQASGNRKQDGGHRGGSGNFAEDRDRASEAGRKGGQR